MADCGEETAICENGLVAENTVREIAEKANRSSQVLNGDALTAPTIITNRLSLQIGVPLANSIP